jgi:hypothetical protein
MDASIDSLRPSTQTKTAADRDQNFGHKKKAPRRVLSVA